MFDVTREDYLKVITEYQEMEKKLIKRVEEVVEEIGFTNKEFDTLEIGRIEFGQKNVYVTAFDSHYDMYDSISGSFPIDFLFEDAEQHKDWYQKKRELAEQEKERREEEEKRQYELKEYERLKAKFE